MIVGIDVDLTVVDTLTGLIQYVKSKLPNDKAIEHLNRAIEIYIETYNNYGEFHELLNSVLKKYNIEESVEEYWKQEQLYDNLSPYPEAYETINWFYKNGAKIVFITSVFPEHYKSKINFILKYFPFTYDFITGFKKYLISGIDYFIDDNINHIEDVMYLGDPNITCFLYRTPFNKDNNKYRTYTWPQIKDWFLRENITYKPRYYKINSVFGGI